MDRDRCGRRADGAPGRGLRLARPAQPADAGLPGLSARGCPGAGAYSGPDDGAARRLAATRGQPLRPARPPAGDAVGGGDACPSLRRRRKAERGLAAGARRRVRREAGDAVALRPVAGRAARGRAGHDLAGGAVAVCRNDLLPPARGGIAAAGGGARRRSSGAAAGGPGGGLRRDPARPGGHRGGAGPPRGARRPRRRPSKQGVRAALPEALARLSGGARLRPFPEAPARPDPRSLADRAGRRPAGRSGWRNGACIRW